MEAHRTRWTHGDELLALILEALDGLYEFTVRAWADKQSRPQPRKPYRYPRPPQPAPLSPAPPRRSTLDEIRRFFRKGR